MLEEGGLEDRRRREADFLDDIGEDGVQLLDILEDSLVVSDTRLGGGLSWLPRTTDCVFSSMMLCRFLLRTHERLRSAHLLHGGPPSSIWHFIWGLSVIIYC